MYDFIQNVKSREYNFLKASTEKLQNLLRL